MANPMNNFELEFSAAAPENDSPDSDGVVQSSLSSSDPSLMGYTNGHVANYPFAEMLSQDFDPTLQAFDQPPRTQGDIEGRLSSVMLSYDTPTTGVSMPLSLDSNGAFAYDIPTTYPSTTMGMVPSMDDPQLHSAFSFHPSMSQQEQYLSPQQQIAPPEVYHGRGSNTTTHSTESLEDSDFSRASERSQQLSLQQSIQDTQRYTPYSQTQHSYRVSQPIAIQPKKPLVAVKEDLSPGLATPDAVCTEHTGIYSNSGFDVLGVLSRVAMRPNPKINIGAVDLSCAFVLCDLKREDHPIVYVSDAFERLTGYTKNEIVGRNCRFLQGPDGQIVPGAKRTFVDGQTVHRLRSTIHDRSEIQTSIINYRKGGQPFMNLITMIPIQWNSEDYRFYVGFQVDLVEKPDAVKGRNMDGTYSVNYQRDQLPQYVVPPAEVFRQRPDLATHFGHDEVTAVLNAAGVPGSGVSRQYLDRILVENSDDVIHVLSFNLEFLYVSPSCKRILEYDPYELVGKTLSTICHPSDIGPVVRDLRSSTTPAPVSIVYRIRQKYKGYIWFEAHGSWHIDPTQGRKYMVMTGRPRPVYALDQVAQLGSKAALAENDIWVKVSLSGVILFVTSKVKPVLGRSPDDLIGKSMHELMELDGDPNAITEALEAAASGQGRDGGSKKNGEPPSFRHQMRHKKGHMLSAHTTLYSGDTPNVRPSFLVAQIRFARAFPPSSAAASAAEDEEMGNVPGTSKSTTLTTMDPNPPAQYGLGQRMPFLSNLVGLNGLPLGNRSISPSDVPATFFTELNPTRGSSWQIELRELEKQNRGLADELQRLLARRKKRKRKQSAVSVEKSCAMCSTKNTPEWRRGPSGNRDLCNSCGLRWAKQVRNKAQAAASGKAAVGKPAAAAPTNTATAPPAAKA
ncbi:GATA transcription factor LreA-like protein [Penicillium ucsense]|uniref:GATA transcription factor LreA-like protein n=1 Tax=Penicillium ucsense TaxID=2839758 RepID=A0A8J8W350_9EURO|nr:GATA transcription factor LreA-like protein [Penicillium ucsense]KAF7733200.1 GATA transcription factor LreA-like protein [Penicillium ucsense]